MNQRKRVLIIAPHPDDELIGCFSVMENPFYKVDVLYAFDHTDATRHAEIEASIGVMHHAALYMEDVHETAEWLARLQDSGADCTYEHIYVPARTDHHAQHKLVNAAFRKFATHFYSVDMVEGRPLPARKADQKLLLLNTCYPSQSLLWQRDQKYWLFEHIATSDFETLAKFVIAGQATVTARPKYKAQITEWALAEPHRIRGRYTEADFSELLTICQGPVALETTDGGNTTLRSSK